MVYCITKYIFWPLFSLFVKRIEGLEHLSDKPAIYVVNHHSYLDGPLILMMLAWHRNVKVYTFATHTTFTGRFWSFVFEHFGAIRVGGSLPKALAKYRAGYPLALFPEGKRNPVEKIGKLEHTGAGVIALQTKAQIIPIGIDTYHFWNRFDRLPRFNRTITICIGTPMRFSLKPTPANVKRSIETMMTEVKHLAKRAHALSTTTQ